MKKVFVLFSAIIIANLCFAQFDGAVGTPGCQAISINNPNIVSWAKGVQVKRGFQSSSLTGEVVSYGKPYNVQGKPDSTTTKAISLGRHGEALITFDRPIINGYGYDFAVFENPFGPNYLELAFVEVSSNGIDFFRFPAISNSTSGADVSADKIKNLAGKYEVGWGTPFDLEELQDNPNLDKMNIRFIKVVGLNGGVDTDSQGNIIYDNSPSSGYAAGFDLTGACILNGGYPYRIANFEGMLTQANSYEIITATNGTLGSDGNYHKNYTNNGIVFEALGLYGGSFACGFGLSNLTNLTNNTGYYASASGGGLEGIDSTYLQAYYSDYSGTAEHNVVRMEDNSIFKPMGVYVCNSAAAYSYSLPANKYYGVIAFGYNDNGAITDSSYVYLRDKRNGDTLNVKEWIWLDLAKLGECSKVIFKLISNEANDYGMLIDAYFCLDNFVIDSSSSPLNLPLSVTTLAATNIDKHSVTLNGNIDLGTQTLSTKGFQWRKTAETTWTDINVTSANLTADLNNLISNTNYTYRAFAIDANNNTIYGTELTFATLMDNSLEYVNANAISLNIYPNPAKDYVNISIDGLDITGVNLSICDIQGRVVIAKDIISNKAKLDISSLINGVYFLKVVSNQRSVTKKLIIK